MTERQHEEADLYEKVRTLCQMYGWLGPFHDYDSRRSYPGALDAWMVHPLWHRLVFCEIKSTKEQLTPEQAQVYAALKAVGPPLEVYVWRPGQEQEIAEILGPNER